MYVTKPKIDVDIVKLQIKFGYNLANTVSGGKNITSTFFTYIFACNKVTHIWSVYGIQQKLLGFVFPITSWIHLLHGTSYKG